MTLAGRICCPGLALSAFRRIAPAAQRVEQLWPEAENTLACFSVRQRLRPLVGRAPTPRGSEVLVSAVTIPDMVRIIQRHGLAPAPVDLDLQQMAPTVEQWERAVTPAAKLILVAHLFGGRTKMEPLLDLVRRHGLLVVEDCARHSRASDMKGIRKRTPACSALSGC